jgi:hypothetical protein
MKNLKLFYPKSFYDSLGIELSKPWPNTWTSKNIICDFGVVR